MIDVRALIDRNRAGETVGLPCFCTANGHVLEAVLQHAAETGHPTVIEATCNQVNQDGGYTGMTATDFIAWVGGLARSAGVPADGLILGGDHLGPNPWRKESAARAMDKARELVRSYAAAGFKKIHLDASMACGGEPAPSFAEIAGRAADLCAVAEANAPDPDALVYIIGTEVPIPGGELDEVAALDVTSVPRFRDTIATHREAFSARGLDAAWQRIAAIVTQPGVDFSHTSVYRFEPEKAAPLSAAILMEPGIVFEAHSTDYQPTDALRALVGNHFFFLKVGPELTFRFREAVFALAAVEDALGLSGPGNLRAVIDECMAERPDAWQDYYKGSRQEVELLKLFSYSDRIRYYWNEPRIAAALDRLIATLAATRMPQTVLSQHFAGYEFGALPADPIGLIRTHTNRCVCRYFDACGIA